MLVPKRHWWGLKSSKAYLESKTLGISDLQVRLTCLLPSRYPRSENQKLWQGLRHLFTSSCSEALPSTLVSMSPSFLRGVFYPGSWLHSFCHVAVTWMWPPCLWLRLATPALRIRDPSGCYSALTAFWAPPRSPWPCTYRWLPGCSFIIVLLYSTEVIYFSLMLPSRFISFSELYVFHCLTHNRDSTTN